MKLANGTEAMNGDTKASNGSAEANGHAQPSSSVLALIPEDIPNMNTSALEMKLRQVRDAAQEHSQILTQKLASSPSGQNLLHIGTSLSTLPPDLHTLLTHMHPFVNVLEGFEQDQRKALTTLVEKATAIRQDQHRVRTAERAADLYADLTSAEACIENQGKNETQENGTEMDAVGKFGKDACFVYCVFDDTILLPCCHRRLGSSSLTRTSCPRDSVFGTRFTHGTRPYFSMDIW